MGNYFFFLRLKKSLLKDHYLSFVLFPGCLFEQELCTPFELCVNGEIYKKIKTNLFLTVLAF